MQEKYQYMYIQILFHIRYVLQTVRSPIDRVNVSDVSVQFVAVLWKRENTVACLWKRENTEGGRQRSWDTDRLGLFNLPLSSWGPLTQIVIVIEIVFVFVIDKEAET